MNRQDPFSEELLSAYLDGELSGDQQREVEQWLASGAEHCQLLDDLRSLQDQLRQLPKYHLGEDFVERVLRETERRSRIPAVLEQGNDFSEELLSAYLDHEASEEQRRQVEAWLATGAAQQLLFDELRTLHASLRTLPVYQLDAGFAERVLRAAALRSLGVPADGSERPVPAVSASQISPATRGGLRHRVLWGISGILAISAATLLILHMSSGPLGKGRVRTEIAQPSSPETHQESGYQPDQENSRPETPPAVAQGKDNLDVLTSEAWQFVAMLAPPLRQKLLLVYELSVTPEGVENAAFANLLKRQNLRFRQTVAVDREEQAALLKRQFLEGVQAGRGDQPGMDEVNLCLVSCTGRQADAMYFDVMSRPPGIASFCLNLTSKDAGQEAEDGALRRLCDANAKPSEAAEAVQLLVNLAVLSRTARQVGAFGIMRVEPSLLKSDPHASPDAAQGSSAQFAGAPLDRDAFRCEILFAVRNLKPLSSEKNGDR
jgi:anti-sigma factor RsiW